MARDPQMRELRRAMNQLVEECAKIAETEGPAAVRKLKVPESDELPPGRGVRVSPEYAEQLAKQARERDVHAAV